MAKKVKTTNSRPAAKQTPAEPKTSSAGMMAARIMGCVCLAIFIFTDEIWLGTASCGLCMSIFFVLQVFIEKTRAWYLSGNFYGAIFCFVIAYLEYNYNIADRIFGG